MVLFAFGASQIVFGNSVKIWLFPFWGLLSSWFRLSRGSVVLVAFTHDVRERNDLLTKRNAASFDFKSSFVIWERSSRTDSRVLDQTFGHILAHDRSWIINCEGQVMLVRGSFQEHVSAEFKWRHVTEWSYLRHDHGKANKNGGQQDLWNNKNT